MAEGWIIRDVPARDDAEVIAEITRSFIAVYNEHFRDEFLMNHELPVEVRAFRRSDGWCVSLLLTPWMLARIFLPEHDPALPIPQGWSAAERTSAPFLVIGPVVEFPLLGTKLKAHLNYLPGLGHFLLQPLALNMQQYADASAVFSAWDEVIETRDRVMEERKLDCEWQKEMSRREFFGFLRQRQKAIGP